MDYCSAPAHARDRSLATPQLVPADSLSCGLFLVSTVHTDTATETATETATATVILFLSCTFTMTTFAPPKLEESPSRYATCALRVLD